MTTTTTTTSAVVGVGCAVLDDVAMIAALAGDRYLADVLRGDAGAAAQGVNYPDDVNGCGWAPVRNVAAAEHDTGARWLVTCEVTECSDPLTIGRAVDLIEEPDVDGCYPGSISDAAAAQAITACAVLMRRREAAPWSAPRAVDTFGAVLAEACYVLAEEAALAARRVTR